MSRKEYKSKDPVSEPIIGLEDSGKLYIKFSKKDWRKYHTIWKLELKSSFDPYMDMITFHKFDGIWVLKPDKDYWYYSLEKYAEYENKRRGKGL